MTEILQALSFSPDSETVGDITSPKTSYYFIIIDGSTLFNATSPQDAMTFEEDCHRENIFLNVYASTAFNVSYANAYVNLNSDFETTCVLAVDCTTFSFSINTHKSIINVFVVY